MTVTTNLAYAESDGLQRTSSSEAGDKHMLYLRAVDRYNKLLSARLDAGVTNGSARQAIRVLFDMTIEGMDEDSPPGCLFVNMAVELASRDSEAEIKVMQGFAQWERLLADLIRKGQQTGEFRSGRKAEELAESMHNTLLGLRVLARTSTDSFTALPISPWIH